MTNLTNDQRKTLRNTLLAAGIKSRGLTNDEMVERARDAGLPVPLEIPTPELEERATPVAERILEDAGLEFDLVETIETTVAPTTTSTEDALKALIDTLTPKGQPAIDEAAIIALIKANTDQTVSYTIKEKAEVVAEISQPHKAFKRVLDCATVGVPCYLVGPAGTGKSTIARSIAKALGRQFYSSAKLSSEFQLVGYRDAQSDYSPTPFYTAYTQGGVFFFDELDASHPDAVVALNDAIASREFTFPCDTTPTKAHKDFYILAAGNTMTRGADRQYTSRKPLDAASVDRFLFVDIDYDNNLEMRFSLAEYKALNGTNEEEARELVYGVQSYRKAALKAGIAHPITPRASLMGVSMLSVGWSVSDIMQACVFKGLPVDQLKQLKAAV